MADSKKNAKKTMPYIPFKTFLGFIERMKTEVLPPQLDSSMFPKMSGSGQSQLFSALRALGLIDDDNKRKPALEKLVNAYGTGDWQETLKSVIDETYAPVVSTLDLNAGTAKQIDGAFREHGGVDGQVLAKAVRFYLSALESAGQSYSPYFKSKRAGAAPKRKAAPKNNTGKTASSKTDQGAKKTAGTPPIPPVDPDLKQFTLHIPGKKDAIVSVPADLEAADWDMAQGVLNLYVSHLVQTNEAKKQEAQSSDDDVDEDYDEDFDDGEDEDYDVS